MTPLCTAGVPEARLGAVRERLDRCGVAAPTPLQRQQKIDMEEWHRNALPDLHQGQPVGRVWEHIATELLLGNMDKPLWGWMIPEGGEAALDFWAGHDSQIRFLLLYTPPLEHLQAAIDREDVAVEDALGHWVRYQQPRLAFYLRHPDRSLVLRLSDFLEAPRSSLAHLVGQEALPARQLVHGCQGSGSDGSASAPPTPEDSQLARYLAQQSLEHVPAGVIEEVQAIYEELEAANPLTPHRQEEPQEQAWQGLDRTPAPLTMGIEGLRRLLRRLHETDEALEQARQAQQAVKEREQQHAARVEELEAVLQDTQQRLEKGLEEGERIELERRLDKARDENEATLLEVDRLQQSLEAEVLARERSQQDSQEALEQARQREQQHATRVEELEERLRRAARMHGAGSYEVATQAAERGAAEQSLDWTLHDTLLGGVLYPELRVRTVGADGQARLEVTTAGVIRQGRVDPSDPESLSGLSTTEYRTARELARLLNRLLPGAELPAGEARSWQETLARLEEGIGEASRELRFDAVELRDERVNPDYEHLWLSLSNPSFDGRQAGHWDFRIACAGVAPGQFGRHPHLQIPRQAEQLLEAWFAESRDEWSEEKLELRFALPNDMDRAVWGRLAEADQRLLTGLIRKLPNLLQALEQAGEAPQRPWADWQQLVADLQGIHERRGR